MKNAYACITTPCQDTEYFQHSRMFSHVPSQSMSIPTQKQLLIDLRKGTPFSPAVSESLDILQPGPASWRWLDCGNEPDTQREAGRELDRERAKNLQAPGSSYP